MAIQLSKHHGITVLVIALLPILIALGNWQLRRAEEKRQLLEQYETRAQQAAVSLNQLELNSDLSYRKVSVTGVYDQQHSYLLDNRVHDGRVGYEVITPFITEPGDGVLINRGWIEAGRTRDELPEIPLAYEGTTTLVASIYQQLPSSEWLQLDNTTEVTTWPRVIQHLEPQRQGTELRLTLFPHQLRLSAEQPGALITDWQPVNQSPAKHQAYAWQWFAMALALLLWQLFANTNLRQIIRSRGAQGSVAEHKQELNNIDDQRH